LPNSDPDRGKEEAQREHKDDCPTPTTRFEHIHETPKMVVFCPEWVDDERERLAKLCEIVNQNGAKAG
jgi:hypothetical protein